MSTQLEQFPIDYHTCNQYLTRLDNRVDEAINSANGSGNSVSSTSTLEGLSVSPTSHSNIATPISPESIQLAFNGHASAWNTPILPLFAERDPMDYVDGQNWNSVRNQSQIDRQVNHHVSNAYLDMKKYAFPQHSHNVSRHDPSYTINSTMTGMHPIPAYVPSNLKEPLEFTFGSTVNTTQPEFQAGLSQTQNSNYGSVTREPLSAHTYAYDAYDWSASVPQSTSADLVWSVQAPSQVPTLPVSPPQPLVSPTNVSVPLPMKKKRSLDSEDSPPQSSPRKRSAAKGKRRKQSAGSTEKENEGKPGNEKEPLKKTAHNMIEKRYRTKLNERIATLRDAVPSLRAKAMSSKINDDDDDDDNEGGATTSRMNKATVLSEARDYIRDLEKRVKLLGDVNDELKQRLETYEKLASMGGQPQNIAYANENHTYHNNLMPRLLVGSLAGLVAANEMSSHNMRHGRGLFAVPIPQMFGAIGGSSSVPFDTAVFFLFKLILVIGACFFVLFPNSVIQDQPSSHQKHAPMTDSSTLSALPSLASPLEVRRKAWLTAIQTVWVPRHSFVLELAALALKFLKLSVRKVIGWNGFAYLTGMTPEREAARVMAWLIALDAQLAGGDVEISRSRILLTFLASLTLPATPSRLMLNAVHIRVYSRGLASGLGEGLANYISRYYWNEARKMHTYCLQMSDTADALPHYLARLIELDVKDVFVDQIVERIQNLTYNRAMNREQGHDESMDAVVEDFAIKSPLDALAAWYSTIILYKVLLASVKESPTEEDQEAIKFGLDIALKVAPPGSNAHLRALSSNAVLSTDSTIEHLQSVMEVFSDDIEFKNSESFACRTTITTINDVRVVVQCAMISSLLQHGDFDRAHPDAVKLLISLQSYVRDIFNTNPSGGGIRILGFVALEKLLFLVTKKKVLLMDEKVIIERIAGALRQWVGGEMGRMSGINIDTRRKLTDTFVKMGKTASGYDDENDGMDAGYMSADGDFEVC